MNDFRIPMTYDNLFDIIDVISIISFELAIPVLRAPFQHWIDHLFIYF